MLTRLRAHHTDEARSATDTAAATVSALLPSARRMALRTEPLRVTAFAEWMLDEREAALARWAGRRCRERIALVHLDRRANVGAAGVDVNIEAGIRRGCRPRAAGARLSIAPTRLRRTPRMPLSASTAGRRTHLDAASAVEQREDGAQYENSPESPAHESDKDSTAAG